MLPAGTTFERKIGLLQTALAAGALLRTALGQLSAVPGPPSCFSRGRFAAGEGGKEKGREEMRERGEVEGSVPHFFFYNVTNDQRSDFYRPDAFPFAQSTASKPRKTQNNIGEPNEFMFHISQRWSPDDLSPMCWWCSACIRHNTPDPATEPVARYYRYYDCWPIIRHAASVVRPDLFPVASPAISCTGALSSTTPQ